LRDERRSSMTDDESVAARVKALADGQGLARCGQPRCGARLGYVLDYAKPEWLSAWGFTYDGTVWRPTRHHRQQRLRTERRVTAGRGDAADRVQLKSGWFARGGDPAESRVMVGKHDRPLIEPPDDPGFVVAERHRLPTLVECPQCGRVNRVADEGA
jgi:hypothetical protein